MTKTLRYIFFDQFRVAFRKFLTDIIEGGNSEKNTYMHNTYCKYFNQRYLQRKRSVRIFVFLNFWNLREIKVSQKKLLKWRGHFRCRRLFDSTMLGLKFHYTFHCRRQNDMQSTTDGIRTSKLLVLTDHQFSYFGVSPLRTAPP